MDKKYNHLQHEKYTQELWNDNKIYKFSANLNDQDLIYNIDTPPPTVSGSLHIGHIFSYVQTDVIARYKRLSGYNVFYPFGFDDNGLPTERYVENKNKVKAYQLKRSEFIKLCLKETQEVEHKFKKLWQQIGLSVDWSLTYSTIDEDTRKISQTSFIELYKQGYIYRKKTPVLYCTNCSTAVAQAELDNVEKSTLFSDIIFKIDDNLPDNVENKKLVIATTRPELLASCVAVLYHPEDKRYIHLEGKQAITPIYNKKVPIFSDELVEKDKGTGLVMVCTFGDKNDIHWFEKYNLPYIQSIDIHGKWTDITGPLSGMRVSSARKKILELLKEEDLIKNQKTVNHSVNTHERCKKEIEYLVTPQWFLNITKYKKYFLDSGDKINWYPDFMQSRYNNWVENIGWDWCLSRQRFYGIPFPVWHCNDCGEIILANINELPIDPQEHKAPRPCTKCPNSNIEPETDVMDTWNTSSLTPYICYNLYIKNQNINNDFNIFNNSVANSKLFSKFMPMSLRPQAHDIIRTWTFYTIAKSWLHNQIVPWNNIAISGHVLTSTKEKISKSKSNTPLDPLSLLKEYPADAIRYWTASTTLGHDTAFSENQLKIGRKLLVKLWNAFRFKLPYLNNFKYDKPIPKDLDEINKSILTKITDTEKLYKTYFDKYEFGLALDSLERFFWSDYCDNYLEFIKDRLFKPQFYSQEDIYKTHWTLYMVGLKILQLYTPFVPHITEILYQYLYKATQGALSINNISFDKVPINFTDKDSVDFIDKVLKVISSVRKLKTENQLSLNTEIKELNIYSKDKGLIDKLKLQDRMLKGITKAENIQYYNNDNIENSKLITNKAEDNKNIYSLSVIINS